MEDSDKMFSIVGKTILITGSYRGLGSSLAEGFAQRGARLVINGRSEEGVMAKVAELKRNGYEAMGATFDISDEIAVREGIAKIKESFGDIHVLVNNAGVQMRNKLVEMPVEDFRRVVDINLTSAFIVTREVAPDMIKARSGKIINICSLMSRLARQTIGNYSAAKGGLKMLTQTMAAEWAQYNIQANGIAPGYFATELTQVLKDDPAFDKWFCNRTPAGRWGDPKELQGAAIFLASQASSYVNGQILYVDGGLSAVV
jgi:gluconate 5-dehydrogenase